MEKSQCERLKGLYAIWVGIVMEYITLRVLIIMGEHETKRDKVLLDEAFCCAVSE